jgi:putative spermidine/putrescine transport system substrate-binding protein
MLDGLVKSELSLRRFAVLAVLGTVMIALLVVACGEDAAPTPVPPEPTALPTGPRPLTEWTCDEPGTLEEVEAALEAHRGGSFIFASWGGSFQGAQRDAWLTPFAQKFGINIVEDTSITYGRVRTIAETGNLVFHVADVSGLQAIGFGLQGAAEPLDCSIIDISGWPNHFKEYFYGGGGAIAWARSILYSTETYPAGSEPTSIVDFFDFENFPGRRGIWTPGGWKGSLRIILAAEMLADDPDRNLTDSEKEALATLDQAEIDHGFELWEEAASNIAVWIGSGAGGGADCLGLLSSGDLDMCNMDTAQMQDVNIGGLPIDFCKTCPHTAFTDQWIITKGTAADASLFELTQLFLAWTSFPERHAAFAKYYPYGPVNADSIPFLNDPAYDATKPYLPTSPDLVDWTIFTNEASDGEMADVMNERWTEFLLDHGG